MNVILTFQKKDGTLTCLKDGENFAAGAHDYVLAPVTESRVLCAAHLLHRGRLRIVLLHRLQSYLSDIAGKFTLQHHFVLQVVLQICFVL